MKGMIGNIGIAGTKAEAEKKKKLWQKQYSRVTISKKLTDKKLVGTGGYKKYHYVITCWE